MANYQGLTELNDSADTLAEASAGLQILNDRLAANGCTLVLDLTPSKDRIYREYMPDGYPIVNEENRTDLLAAYLQSHTTVPVVWRYDMLRSQARQDPERLLYYKTDTRTGTPSARSSGWTVFLRRWTCRRARRTATLSRPAARPPVTWQCGGALRQSARRGDLP